MSNSKGNSTKRKILVVGATGKVGSALVRNLVEAGEFVKAATRNIDQDFGKNVEATFFDFDDANSFASALSGVNRIFYLSRPADDQAAVVAKPFFEKAAELGVNHIVNMTALGVDADDSISLRQVEILLEQSNIPYTHLRPNWFMQNFTTGNFGPMIREQSGLFLPAANAEVSFIDVRDIAAVAALVLTQPGHFSKAYNLTGNVALNHSKAAEQISEASGRDVSYHPISSDDFAKALASQQTPESVIAFMQMLFGAMREGYNAPILDDTANILGRSPISFSAFVGEFFVDVDATE